MGRSKTIGLKRIVVNVGTPKARVPIVPESLFVTDFEVYVKSSNSGANMYVGDKNVDTTWIPRAKGTTTNFVHGTGNFLGSDAVPSFDLSTIYLIGESDGDTAVIGYYAGEKK